jgi:hypothetical protein
MYTFIREVSFKTMMDSVRGIPVTQAIVKYYKDAHGLEMVLQRPIAGLPTRLRFVSRMESMDASRALNLKAAQDPVFQKYLAEMALLVDGSKTLDEIWQ